MVSQSYTVNLVEENVLRGNSAILKCLIPSFVTEYVSVSSWIVTEEGTETEIKIDDNVNNYGERKHFLYDPIPISVISYFPNPQSCHKRTLST